MKSPKWPSAIAVTGLVSSVAIFGYAYIAYPLLLAVRRTRGSDTCAVGELRQPMESISVCIPVHRWTDTLEAKLESLLAQTKSDAVCEVILYVDGGEDCGLVDQVHRIEAAWVGPPSLLVISKGVRGGKPAAINAMVDAAMGELILLTDARQPITPGAIEALQAAMRTERADAAAGVLVPTPGAPAGVYWKYENLVRRLEARRCGSIGFTALAMMRRSAVPRVPDDIVLDDMWLPLTLVRQGARIPLVPEAVAIERAFGAHEDFSRKVRTQAGLIQLARRESWLLRRDENPVWFELMSHKYARIAAAWAFVPMAVCLGILAGRETGGGGATGRAGLIGLAGLGTLSAMGQRAGRVGSAARSLAVLNLAAIVGSVRGFRREGSVLW